MAEDSNRPERPRVEPQIIPPDRSQHRSNWGLYGYTQSGGSHRLYVTRLGPLSVALLMLAVAAIVAVILFIVLGAVLLWIPVIAVLVVAAAIASVFRR